MKLARLSENARNIIERAKEHDSHLNPKTGAHRGANHFWTHEVKLAGLNEYDRKQLARYAMHSCFGQVRYREGRPEKERVELSKKFGMTEFEFQRWSRRYLEADNWTYREINDWGTRGFYGIHLIPAQFRVLTKKGHKENNLIRINYNYSNTLHQIETEFASEDKLKLRERVNAEAKRTEEGINYEMGRTFPESPHMMGWTCFRDEQGDHNFDGYLGTIYFAKQRTALCKKIGLGARAKILENKIAQLAERYKTGIESWKLSPDKHEKWIAQCKKYTQEI